MGTARKDMADTAMARSHVYGLLATIFRAEPTEALLKELKGPRFSRVFSDLGLDLGDEFHDKPEAEVADELAVEYTRLFLGPGPHISPHESVHSEVDRGGWSNLWGEETVRVKKFIETTGLEYAPDYTGIPDHISVELEFVQKLALWEAAAWSKGGDTEGALYCLKVEKMFLDEHLSKWVPPFCDKVIAQAELPFYREMAGVTKDFLDFDRQRIDELMAPESRSRDA
jgi:TorA maturation chaperone TorD